LSAEALAGNSPQRSKNTQSGLSLMATQPFLVKYS